MLFDVADYQGTTPFMSIRLLGSTDASLPILHTAIDDLESFIWIALWNVLDAEPRTAREEKWLARLQQDEFDQVKNQKTTIVVEFVNEKMKNISESGYSKGLVKLKRLFYNWFQIALRATEKLNDFLGRDTPALKIENQILEDMCRDYYIDYLRAAVSLLEDKVQPLS